MPNSLSGPSLIQVENRVRWQARRRGYAVEKARVIKRALPGGFRLRCPIGKIVLGEGYTATIDEVSRFLKISERR